MVRQVELSDALQLGTLFKSIDNSGFMLFEPEERETSSESMISFIDNMLSSYNSNCYVAEKNGELVGYLHGRVK